MSDSERERKLRAMLLGHFCLAAIGCSYLQPAEARGAATTQTGATTRTDTIDLSDPKKAFVSNVMACLNADAAAMKRCVYIASPADEPQIESEIQNALAHRQFAKAAEARFGVDADPTGPGMSFTEKSLRGVIEQIGLMQVDQDGRRASLSSPDRNKRKSMIKTADGWKVEGSHFGLAADRDASEKRNRAETEMLHGLTQQLEQGKFKDIQAVRAAYTQGQRDLGAMRK
jgi:hypothetical protein